MLDAPGRLYLQRGTAYVDSGPRPARAGIEVVTPAGTARDLGTQFELQVAGTALRLRVREGAVAIDHGGRSLTGQAGEEVSIDAFGGVLRATIPPDDPAWQWAEAIAPMPDMDGQPAATLIAWVARETGRRLRYESPLVEQRAGTVILHGEIRHLAPMEALEAMLATTDLRVELDGNTMEIRARSTIRPGREDARVPAGPARGGRRGRRLARPAARRRPAGAARGRRRDPLQQRPGQALDARRARAARRRDARAARRDPRAARHRRRRRAGRTR